MASDRVIPTPAPSDLPTMKILIGGSELNNAYQVVSVDVSKSFNKMSGAKIVVIDGDPAKEDFEISNTDDFKPGNEIEVQAGYHSSNETIFKGIIIKHGLKVRKFKPSLLIIEAKDKAVKMTVGRKSLIYYNSKDSEIIEEIIGNYSLEKDVEATNLQHKEMVQNYSTDWDFLVSRAEMNGKLALADDGKLIVKKPDTGSSPVLTLVYGSTMMEFEAEMDSRTQLKSVKSHSWNYKDQEFIEAEASDPGVTENGNISSSDLSKVIGLSEYTLKHSGNVEDTELKSWADAKNLKSKLARIKGRVKFQGFTGVKPGNMIELKGVGERFNGNVFVSGVRHQINPENWETDVQFGLSDQWFYKNKDIVDNPAAGLVPNIYGLQIGTATQLEEDPDGENRVLVKIPIIDNQNNGLWARVATLDAGENRGSFFLPEIGDEVIVGFVNDDPRDPVILGMLNSSAKPAPLVAEDANNEKGFVTRSEMKMIFNDGKKSIAIETPAGKKVTIDEDAGVITIEDENGNKAEFSSGGITIESAADLIMKAAGDVKIEGTNITVSANAQFKAEGSAGAEMSTGASAVVKGSVVQIN
ncbi:MAG: type VI secretion system tip protein VgrG [Ignavibacteria bacterium]